MVPGIKETLSQFSHSASFCRSLISASVLGIKLPFKYYETFIPERPVKAMEEI